MEHPRGVIIYSGTIEDANILLDHQSDHLLRSLDQLTSNGFICLQAKQEEKILRMIKQNPHIVFVLIGLGSTKYAPLLSMKETVSTHLKFYGELPNENIYGQINWKLKALGHPPLSQ